VERAEHLQADCGIARGQPPDRIHVALHQPRAQIGACAFRAAISEVFPGGEHPGRAVRARERALESRRQSGAVGLETAAERLRADRAGRHALTVHGIERACGITGDDEAFWHARRLEEAAAILG
jgi:hypothetical protein